MGYFGGQGNEARGGGQSTGKLWTSGERVGDWENGRVSELERSLRAIWPRCTPQVSLDPPFPFPWPVPLRSRVANPVSDCPRSERVIGYEERWGDLGGKPCLYHLGCGDPLALQRGPRVMEKWIWLDETKGAAGTNRHPNPSLQEGVSAGDWRDGDEDISHLSLPGTWILPIQAL
ncbi:hypothetical protein FA13DRAFT_1708178 [Coprinellus micaceus]|uniref:Uncharacterized protein n=1 Tax=Coprinellus micaceus TaxID=71717 RepID=A0A4Y7TIM4_COPMI|nr:hypothetical protein FA13DRAFT_1708178 [Coprinellus micaceus]